ncbi:hypothetical protein EXS65_01650 [Candidatus Peribacteria bacterium]|nr:hypothetical protein [Candidatus Peribacteria bacterium]
MKRHFIFNSGHLAFTVLVVMLAMAVLLISIRNRQIDSSALRGMVTSSQSSEPSISITELLKNFFGIGLSPSSSVVVNPDPTNDCGKTINPFPGQCIAGQERCCKGKWICPNVLGQYVCD